MSDCRVDVSAIVSSIVDDMSDAGLAFGERAIELGVIVDCKRLALRRAITNLIDNAV